MADPIYNTRKEAKLNNTTQYFTGTECDRGHVANRYVNNYKCIVCAREDHKEWVITNPIKQREMNQKHKQSNIEYKLKVATQLKESKKVNINTLDVGQNRQYAIQHGISKYISSTICKNGCSSLVRYTTSCYCVACKDNYRKRNRERILKQNKEYRERNKAAKRFNDAKRRATKLKATPSWMEHTEIKKLYKECVQLAKELNVNHHVHHVIPLQECNDVCGLHCRNNLVILTEEEHIIIHSSQDNIRSLWNN